ncbi:MAG: hypothetical protein AAF514_15325, partial [Verrucomicrobiota bacterium]
SSASNIRPLISSPFLVSTSTTAPSASCLAGMPMPWLDPMHREECGGPINAYEDELSSLWEAGIRSVACLLNIPGDQMVYESAGFKFLCLPIPNGGAPSNGRDIHLFMNSSSPLHPRSLCTAKQVLVGLER